MDPRAGEHERPGGPSLRSPLVCTAGVRGDSRGGEEEVENQGGYER